MKTNQSSFDLIPEESEEMEGGNHNSDPNQAMAAAQQAAIAARIFQAQHGNHLPAELALHQQLFNHQQQLLHQKILEEQFARNRDLHLLMSSEAAAHNSAAEQRDKQIGLIFQQVGFFPAFILNKCRCFSKVWLDFPAIILI